MELDELKSLWKDENKMLGDRIELVEKLLRKMNLDKVVSEYDKLLKRSILGRNLALVYFAISIMLSLTLIKEYEYSIPCLLGGIAMLWSFIDHLSIRKSDYSQLSIIDLQKTISKFRIHTSETAKYDISIVLFWFLTITPVYLKLIHKISIFSDFKFIMIFSMISLIIIILSIFPFKNIYKDYDLKLRQSEEYLNEIIEFEKF